jgi:predicted RNA-binding protein YlqC (UPF0109 family)
MEILQNIFKSMLTQKKEVDLKKLPSMGLFYKDDFKIWIKKASIEDIIEYEYNYQKEDLGNIIGKVKKIVKKNTILSNGYSYNDIKSLDIVFLFLNIVRFTNNKDIEIKHLDTSGKIINLKFNEETFNYADLDRETMLLYNNESKEFIIDGFRYSPPSIGVENSITNYLISKSDTPGNQKYSEYNYDFLFFLGHKNKLSEAEIENLIQIFNYDISDKDSEKIGEIIIKFSNIGRYQLKRESVVIDITAKIDLEKIWN